MNRLWGNKRQKITEKYSRESKRVYKLNKDIYLLKIIIIKMMTCLVFIFEVLYLRFNLSNILLKVFSTVKSR